MNKMRKMVNSVVMSSREKGRKGVARFKGGLGGWEWGKLTGRVAAGYRQAQGREEQELSNYLCSISVF